jgi:hypothetical protein
MGLHEALKNRECVDFGKNGMGAECGFPGVEKFFAGVHLGYLSEMFKCV